MIIPIKCFSCGKVLADKYQYYLDNVSKTKTQAGTLNNIVYLSNNTNTNKKTSAGQIMDKLGLTKMCCRRHILSHVDIE